MFLLATLFLKDNPDYMTGLIIIGLAPCIAMVVVWNELAQGNRELVAGLVGINSLLQVLFFSSYAYFYLKFMLPLFGIDAQTIDIHFWDIALTVGIYLGIQSTMESRQKSRIARCYDYVNENGVLLHQTVRMEPKDFRQRRPDPAKPGEWIWSISGISPVLYRLPELIATQWVCLVGGEKDVENLVSIGIPATTNPMGEGNWRDSYNQHFAGKAVIILPDRDDVGRKHAQVVAFAIKSIAKSIRIIELPFPDDADPHKDPSDWIAYHKGQGHNDAAIADNLKRIIKDTPIIDAAQVEQPNATQQEIINAKRANKEPFRNYDWADAMDDKVKEKRVKSPRHINAMREDIMRRFFNFPRRIGSSLFDHDRETKKINIFDRPPELMGWIQEKSKHNIEWA
jgi:hypothetical protein